MQLCSTVVNRYEKVLTTCASTQHVGLLESFYPCPYLLMKPATSNLAVFRGSAMRCSVPGTERVHC